MERNSFLGGGGLGGTWGTLLFFLGVRGYLLLLVFNSKTNPSSFVGVSDFHFIQITE